MILRKPLTSQQQPVEAATRVALMDAAETLFGEHGFDGASLREITGRAKANLASVSYHFGSKEGLFLETWARRVHPLNQRRIELLDAAMSQNGGQPPIEAVLDAYARPLFDLTSDNSPQGRALLRLVVRMAHDDAPNKDSLNTFEREMKPVVRRFAEAMRKAEPKLSSSEVLWSFYFFSGATFAMLNGGKKFRAITGNAADQPGSEEALRRLIAFCAAGVRASIRA